MTVINLGKGSPSSKSWWQSLKQKWKARHQKKNDRFIMKALVKSIGLKPTEITYNYDHQYYEVLWKRSEETSMFFQIKVGQALFIEDEDEKKRMCVWCKFAHPDATKRGAVQFPIYDSADASQLIMESRQAILMLRLEM